MRYLAYEIAKELMALETRADEVAEKKVLVNPEGEAQLVEDLKALSRIQATAGSIRSIRGVPVHAVLLSYSDRMHYEQKPYARVGWYDNKTHGYNWLSFTVESDKTIVRKEEV